MARRKEPIIPDAILDQLLAGADTKTALDQNGLLEQLKKALTERALRAELDHHLVTAEDFVLSGVFERLARDHRVICIDRPGYGYSDRPQSSVERPVVVGHSSWGMLVALELALGHPNAVRGLVLLSGYYKPTARAPVSSVIIGARNEAQLRDNLGAVGWILEPEQIASLDTASDVIPAYPYYPYRTQEGFARLNPMPV
jgi:pimeloyl-ACP methyl ester carboxylesterase